MMNIFKAFGLKKATRTKEEVAKDPTMAIATDWDEIDRKSKRDWKAEQARRAAVPPSPPQQKWSDAQHERALEEDWARDWSDHFAAREPELGEGEPVKGRGLPKKYYGDRPRPSAEGTIPGRTDFLDEKQYTSSPEGQTLADKRAGRAVLNMFKVFGLDKDDVSGKNYGGGKFSPSSEKDEEKTPGGPDLETDLETGDISVVPDPEEDENGGENGE